MESNRSNFRLRLNLFDAIVLLAALAVGAALLWNHLKPQPQPGEVLNKETIQYTVRFQKFRNDMVDLVQPGDPLTDNIKNHDLGHVVSVEAVPAIILSLDNEHHCYVESQLEGYSDLLVTVEVLSDVNRGTIQVGSGEVLRTGIPLYIRGRGYMASGPVVEVNRAQIEAKEVQG